MRTALVLKHTFTFPLYGKQFIFFTGTAFHMKTWARPFIFTHVSKWFQKNLMFYFLQLNKITSLLNFEIFCTDIQIKMIYFTWTGIFTSCFLVLIWHQTILHHLYSGFQLIHPVTCLEIIAASKLSYWCTWSRYPPLCPTSPPLAQSSLVWGIGWGGVDTMTRWPYPLPLPTLPAPLPPLPSPCPLQLGLVQHGKDWSRGLYCLVMLIRGCIVTCISTVSFLGLTNSRLL